MSLKLAVGVPFVCAFIALGMTAWHQHQTLIAEREAMAVLQANFNGQARVISILELHAKRNAQDSAELTNTLQQVQALTSDSRQIWETLKRDNEEFKAWASADLPADVIRLRSRPAITGAAEYQSWLQQSQRLHPASQPTADQ